MISDKPELEKVLSLIRKEIESSELAKKLSELDSKLVELRKAVEGIVIELTYIKSELKDLRENGREKRPAIARGEDKTVEKIEKKVKVEEAKLDVIKRDTELEKATTTETRRVEDDKDIIICD